jgi:hypothetical protein
MILEETELDSEVSVGTPKGKSWKENNKLGMP